VISPEHTNKPHKEENDNTILDHEIHVQPDNSAVAVSSRVSGKNHPNGGWINFQNIQADAPENQESICRRVNIGCMLSV